MRGLNLGHLRYLPTLCFLWLVLTFIVSYAVAVSLDHVYPLWPYISDTGTIAPESCIFGLMLNIGAFLMGLVLFIRYQQIKLILINQTKYLKTLKYLNIFCLVTGMLAAFGACIVANFQETSDIKMHLIGANLCFGVGSAYFIIHTLICFLINRKMKLFNFLRTLLCVLYVVSFATTLIFAQKAFALYKVDFHGALKWNSDNPGYDYRLVSTFSEWVLGICQGLYILSFSYDFKYIEFNMSFTLLQKVPIV